MMWPLVLALVAAIFGKSKSSMIWGAVLGLVPAFVVGTYVLPKHTVVEHTRLSQRVEQQAVDVSGEKQAQFVVFAADPADNIIRQYSVKYANASFRESNDGQTRLLTNRVTFTDPRSWLVGLCFPSTEQVVEYPAAQRDYFLKPITDPASEAMKEFVATQSKQMKADYDVKLITVKNEYEQRLAAQEADFTQRYHDQQVAFQRGKVASR